MLLDGFTIAAQIINFLTLVFLLKKFLYRPVIRAMEEREDRIKKAVAQAEMDRRKAEEQSKALALEKMMFSEKKAELMAEAKEEISRWREEKIEALKLEIILLKNAWTDELDKERRAFLLRLKEDTIRHVMGVAQKAMRDLAGRDLEESIVSVFLEKTQGLENSFKSLRYSGLLRVISGFALSEKSRKEIENKLCIWFPSAKGSIFEISEKPGIGIEISAGDKKTAWNLEKYLKDLEKKILPEHSSEGVD